MNVRIVISVIVLTALLDLSVSAARGETPRPNLVFVFTDQQSWDTLGCYGNTQTHTPHLDSLAAEGVRFLSNNCAVDFRPQAAFYWDGDRKAKFGTWEHSGQTDQAVEFIEASPPDWSTRSTTASTGSRIPTRPGT